MVSCQTVKPLPEKLRKNGFEYTLIIRGERSFVFRQNVSPGIDCYEVFMLKLSKSKTIKEMFISARERFPRDEDFGVWAWTYQSYEKAMMKLFELENENFNA